MDSDNDVSIPRGPGRGLRLEQAVEAALCAAVALAAVTAARNDWAPTQRPATFALVAGGSFLGVALAVLLPPALAGALAAFRAPRVAAVLEGVGRVAAVVVAGLLLAFNPRPFRQLLHLRPTGEPLPLLLGVAAVVAVVGLLLRGLAPVRGRHAVRLATLAAAVLFLVASRPPSATRTGSASVPPPSAAVANRPRFLLFGIDGADWNYVDILMARGELPHLAALKARGAWGDLATLQNASSPIIWNTVATGQPPEVHGIDGFTKRYLRGVHEPLRGPVVPPRGFGLDGVDEWLENRGLLYEATIPSTARRVPAYWNIATRLGSPVGVLNWWATWPAEPVLGAIVSERMHFWRFAARGHWTPQERLTFPDDLGPRFGESVMSPDQVTYEDARAFFEVSPEDYAQIVAEPFRGKTVEGEFPYMFSMLQTNRRHAGQLIDWGTRRFGQLPDMLVLDRTVDVASHAALAQSELVPEDPAKADDRRRFGRVVSEAYRRSDAFLGELVAKVGAGVNVVVLSDHGFRKRAGAYHHTWGPPGIFVAAGPAFRPGRVEGLHVRDVLPLLLYLKGFPVADDLPGRVPLEVFTPEFAGQEIVRIPSYGSRSESGSGAGAAGVDEEALERLRALGYID